MREAYQQTVAEQDTARRRPVVFADAWRAHLDAFLRQPAVELHGWGEIILAEQEISLAWDLFESASQARKHAIEHASAERSRRAYQRQQMPTFEFSIVADGQTLGDVTYGTIRESSKSNSRHR